MPPRQARLRSFAKINLDLRVLHKRPDGFHEIRTIFQTVSLADTIQISFQASRGTAIRLDSDIPNNLILRAAHAVLDATRTTAQLDISLTKQIPMGGGLGGGSSNAAAILLALPVLIGVSLPLETLLDLGAQLGSDVPFFLLGGTALGVGRGSELYPAPEPAPQPALLLTPDVHVSTAEAYVGLNRQLTPETPSRTISSFQALAWGIGEGGPDGDWPAVNDFETVVFSRYPLLKSLKGKLLKLGARFALMSGSGSTLFGIFHNREARDLAALKLRSQLGKNSVHPVSLLGRRPYRNLWYTQLRPHLEGRQWPPLSRYSK